MFVRQVNDQRATFMGSTHSYWDIDVYDPNTGANTNEVISGGPNTVVGKTGKAKKYLNITIHAPFDGPTYTGLDTVGNGTEWYTGGLSSTDCAGVESMSNYANSWPQNSIIYNSVSGPNSNTVAYLLGQAGGFSPTAPPGAYGWPGWPL
jgi:hypothetical protein